MITRAIATGVAIAMAVFLPFSGVGVKAAEATTLKMENFDSAFSNEGVSFNGVTYRGDEFYVEPGNYVFGEDIKLANYSRDVNFTSGTSIIDLNGKDADMNLWVYTESSEAPTDVTIKGSGSVAGELWCEDQCTMTLNGGSYDYVSILDSSMTINAPAEIEGLYSCEGSDLTINGGSFGYLMGYKYYGLAEDIGSEEEEDIATIVINGGTFESEEFPCAVTSYIPVDMTINGGTFSGSLFGMLMPYFDSSFDYSLAINGGEFEGGLTGMMAMVTGGITLSGGTFTSTGDYERKVPMDEFVVANVAKEDDQGSEDVPLSGILFACEEEGIAKTIFSDVLADGYEYSPAITPTYELEESSKYKALAYADQASFSVVKTPEPEEEKKPEEKKEEEKKTETPKYSNEWVDGKWYNADGTQTYKGKGQWKVNSDGWWYEDDLGWFPKDGWQKIDGKWYFFDSIGYMATNCYAGSWEAYGEGSWWVGADGAWDGSEPGVWRLSGSKWWFGDSTGWYAKNAWYKIRGTWYWFNADGYWEE